MASTPPNSPPASATQPPGSPSFGGGGRRARKRAKRQESVPGPSPEGQGPSHAHSPEEQDSAPARSPEAHGPASSAHPPRAPPKPIDPSGLCRHLTDLVSQLESTHLARLSDCSKAAVSPEACISIPFGWAGLEFDSRGTDLTGTILLKDFRAESWLSAIETALKPGPPVATWASFPSVSLSLLRLPPPLPETHLVARTHEHMLAVTAGLQATLRCIPPLKGQNADEANLAARLRPALNLLHDIAIHARYLAPELLDATTHRTFRIELARAIAAGLAALVNAHDDVATSSPESERAQRWPIAFIDCCLVLATLVPLAEARDGPHLLLAILDGLLHVHRRRPWLWRHHDCNVPPEEQLAQEGTPEMNDSEGPLYHAVKLLSRILPSQTFSVLLTKIMHKLQSLPLSGPETTVLIASQVEDDLYFLARLAKFKHVRLVMPTELNAGVHMPLFISLSSSLIYRAYQPLAEFGLVQALWNELSRPCYWHRQAPLLDPFLQAPSAAVQGPVAHFAVLLRDLAQQDVQLAIRFINRNMARFPTQPHPARQLYCLDESLNHSLCGICNLGHVLLACLSALWHFQLHAGEELGSFRGKVQRLAQRVSSIFHQSLWTPEGAARTARSTWLALVCKLAHTQLMYGIDLQPTGQLLRDLCGLESLQRMDPRVLPCLEVVWKAAAQRAVLGEYEAAAPLLQLFMPQGTAELLAIWNAEYLRATRALPVSVVISLLETGLQTPTGLSAMVRLWCLKRLLPQLQLLLTQDKLDASVGPRLDRLWVLLLLLMQQNDAGASAPEPDHPRLLRLQILAWWAGHVSTPTAQSWALAALFLRDCHLELCAASVALMLWSDHRQQGLDQDATLTAVTLQDDLEWASTLAQWQVADLPWATRLALIASALKAGPQRTRTFEQQQRRRLELLQRLTRRVVRDPSVRLVDDVVVNANRPVAFHVQTIDEAARTRLAELLSRIPNVPASGAAGAHQSANVQRLHARFYVEAVATVLVEAGAVLYRQRHESFFNWAVNKIFWQPPRAVGEYAREELMTVFLPALFRVLGQLQLPGDAYVLRILDKMCLRPYFYSAACPTCLGLSDSHRRRRGFDKHFAEALLQRAKLFAELVGGHPCEAGKAWLRLYLLVGPFQHMLLPEAPHALAGPLLLLACQTLRWISLRYKAWADGAARQLIKAIEHSGSSSVGTSAETGQEAATAARAQAARAVLTTAAQNGAGTGVIPEAMRTLMQVFRRAVDETHVTMVPLFSALARLEHDAPATAVVISTLRRMFNTYVDIHAAVQHVQLTLARELNLTTPPTLVTQAEAATTMMTFYHGLLQKECLWQLYRIKLADRKVSREVANLSVSDRRELQDMLAKSQTALPLGSAADDRVVQAFARFGQQRPPAPAMTGTTAPAGMEPGNHAEVSPSTPEIV
ncbi:uncharacterized protein MONBRDRAFT_12280 [Monosiga brevicollis MX1]|uniref:Uncharacterized protein n=1 Tax=Monosiga brevicollis TaxID=81824 RepID=A9VBS4_MONBE|nr:uncharacterized protein MONBRDRAFT_12280 [Monosiga brevicollis MX1]EDQ84983.1 predicted protein [Monosiga brevicollis MX1]|eukprot:XP_001750153.1 hypothetical protein [Monosiga brevicollis MX1]